MRRWLPVAMAVAWLLLGCEAIADVTPRPTQTISPDTGIRGIVLLGPTCAVQPGPTGGAEPGVTPSPVGTPDPSFTPGPAPTAADPCVTPFVAEIVILDRRNAEVTRVRSGPDGRFEVLLPPGDYTVAPVPGDPYPTAPAQAVSVTAGEFTEIEIDYDSGIR
jgi:hypothetical protein